MKHSNSKKHSPFPQPRLEFQVSSNNVLLLVPFLFLFCSSLTIISSRNIGYPLFDFLFKPAGRGDDFFNGVIYSFYIFDSRFLLDYPNFSGEMSPFAVLFGQLFAFFSEGNLSESNLRLGFFIYLLICILFLVFSCSKLIKHLTGTIRVDDFLTLLTLSLLSYPVIFALSRGNLDALFCSMFINMYICFEKEKYSGAAFWIMILAAFKPPYLLFAVLFLSKRNYRHFFLTSFGSIALFFAPLLLLPFKISEAVENFFKITHNYHEAYIIGDAGLLFNNSLHGLIKSLIYISQNDKEPPIIETAFIELITKIYYLPVALLLIFVVFQIWKKQSSTAKNWALISSVSVLLPPVAASYRLVMFIPLIGLLILSKNKISLRLMKLSLIFLIFFPKPFLWITWPGNGVGVTLDTIVNPIFLIVILFFATYSEDYSDSVVKTKRQLQSEARKK